jgi:hypothetical protein
MSQDSIIYLYLITNVFKFYCRSAFIYNYSGLFDAINKNGDSYHQHHHAQPRRSVDARLKSIVSVASTNKQADFTSRSVQLSSAQSSTGSPTRRLTHQTSSVVDGSVKRNKLFTYYMNMVAMDSGKSGSGSLRTERLHLNVELLKLVLSDASHLCHTSQSGALNFDHSDMNIVLNLLKTLQIKQIYIYNLAMHNKKLMEIRDEMKGEKTRQQQQESSGNETVVKAMSGSSSNQTFCTSSYVQNLNTLLKTEIQFPLLVEYEENFTVSCKKK